MKTKAYIPVTPAGGVLADLESTSRPDAWQKLLKATEHIPYRTLGELIEMGYSVEVFKRFGDDYVERVLVSIT